MLEGGGMSNLRVWLNEVERDLRGYINSVKRYENSRGTAAPPKSLRDVSASWQSTLILALQADNIDPEVIQKIRVSFSRFIVPFTGKGGFPGSNSLDRDLGRLRIWFKENIDPILRP